MGQILSGSIETLEQEPSLDSELTEWAGPEADGCEEQNCFTFLGTEFHFSARRGCDSPGPQSRVSGPFADSIKGNAGGCEEKT